MFWANRTVIVSLASICLAYCEEAREKRHPDAAPGTCISEVYDLLMRAGQTTPVRGECADASCDDNGEITYNGCSNVYLPPNCKFVETNGNLPFPHCCDDEYICEE